MDEKQKARAYDEALKRARRIKNGEGDWHYSDLIEIGPALTEIFPELAESEDEKIRKWIFNLVNNMSFENLTASECAKNEEWKKKVLAYLEKQKEQNDIPLMNGDADLYFDTWIQHNDTTKRGCFEEGIRYAQRLQKEQKPTEKQDYSGLNDLERAIHRGFLSVGVENVPVTIIKETALECLAQMKPAEWSEEDEKTIERLITRLNWITYNTRTNGTSPNITFFDEIEWLKSLRPQPHKEIYQAAKHDLAIKFMNYLDDNRPEGKMGLSNGECEDIDKAFKENDWAKIERYIHKYHWKPSEEQMDALNVLNCHGDLSYVGQQNQLISLYNDLKKLM